MCLLISYRVLRLSDGLGEPGAVNWDLALCLLLAWILCFVCIVKGVKISGKVFNCAFVREREQKISFRVIQSTQDSWYLARWLLEDHSCRGRRPWDPKLSPAVRHGLMLGFTLDWSFMPHSDEDCEGGIMAVLGGGNDVGRKRNKLKPDSPLMSSEAPCIAGGLFINYL